MTKETREMDVNLIQAIAGLRTRKEAIDFLTLQIKRTGRVIKPNIEIAGTNGDSTLSITGDSPSYHGKQLGQHTVTALLDSEKTSAELLRALALNKRPEIVNQIMVNKN